MYFFSKHCIENEKQWDFLKDLTAKIPDITACNEKEGSPKRGRLAESSTMQTKFMLSLFCKRKRKNSNSKVSEAPTKQRKSKKIVKPENNNLSAEDDDQVSHTIFRHYCIYNTV